MNGFDREVLARVPLAEAVWTLLRHVADAQLLGELFERHRGTGCERDVRFALLVDLVCDALLQYGGSGRQSFRAAREANRLNCTNEAVYGKLRRVPLELSEAFVRETAQRLREVLPESQVCEIPPALRDFQVLIFDGKKIKGLPKRLKPLREVRGKVLGGKIVAGLLLNGGLVVAMQASPDGEANDAPLTPGLLDQCQKHLSGPLLYVADRQFCDLKIPRGILERGQSFLIRYSKRMLFSAEEERSFRDAQGRTVREAWGWLGRAQDPRRLYVRQITLERPGEEEIILVTNLLDAQAIPNEALLEVYLTRWTIERVFQQVSEVFHLQQLISSSPQGAIFQFALCALLYNVIQVIRGYIAWLQSRPPASLSSEMIFRSTCDQLTACAVMLPGKPLVDSLPELQTAVEVCQRLTQLLAKQWTEMWIKSPTKKKTRPSPQRPVPGGHSSAWKLIRETKAIPPPR